MKISDVFNVKKENVKFCKINQTVGEAFDFIKESGYRCIPVLDESEHQFMGNLYKVHVYEYLYEKGGKREDSLQSLARDQEQYMNENTSFLHALFHIHRFPYIAIEGENKEFKGLLTHSNVIHVLEDSLGRKTGKYSITLGKLEYRGALREALEIVNQHTNVEGVITLDSGSKYARRFVVTIPKVETEAYDAIMEQLDRRGYHILDVEKL